MVKAQPSPYGRQPPDFQKEYLLATARELSDFLASVERRAFRQATYAVRDDESALDIVQDAMMKLAEKYGDRPQEEFPMLFQRILQNGIRDHYRRHKVRSTWTSLFSMLAPKDEDDYDPLETMELENTSKLANTPHGQYEQTQVMALIEAEISKLPPRQREAFLMRYWEDMDVAETAVAMGCSEGSVKTHCSRATHALATVLKLKGITL